MVAPRGVWTRATRGFDRDGHESWARTSAFEFLVGVPPIFSSGEDKVFTS